MLCGLGECVLVGMYLVDGLFEVCVDGGVWKLDVILSEVEKVCMVLLCL